MQGNEALSSAIEAANQNGRFFCKFISANDVGINGAHQEGVYLNKKSWDMFFHEPIPSIGILDRQVKIHIDDWEPFESRVVYYTSKKEFRITQFWTNTPFEKNEAVGALIAFIPVSPDDYKVYLFNTEEEIEEFIDTFSLSLLNNFAIYNNINGQEIEVVQTLEDIINQSIEGIENFPTTAEMSQMSRDIFINFHKKKVIIPDKDLLNWVDTEYTVFRMLEKYIYRNELVKPFMDIEPLIEFANMALNRRKSRAGKSLENHVNYIFTSANLPFNNPGRTEAKKKPDFLFPSTEEYKNIDYPDNKLIMLGAKTTCKDRWRQVLNEANRIPHKHLLTLQQGISKNQMDEMQEENLTLVVPKPLHGYYPKEYQERLWTLEQFIRFIKEKYSD
ncbi:type II restriction endonuclease [Cytobacillus gottheilii]|uniref:type II restriction endonuclease n=1 Tax=Cytobacillus gottheilii TaxID=859144 RepID=UPI00082D02B0|nr:type II restriction endonuclease [Cytobacillus gottheilii]